jgi:hypothetical protein
MMARGLWTAHRLRVLLVGILVVGITSMATPAFGAAEDTIDVSPDGTVFTEQFGGLLAGNVMVPLGVATDTFLVRNSSNSPGYVRIVVTDIQATDDLFVESSAIRLSSDSQSWEGVPLGSAQPCAQVANDLVLQPGQVQSLTATLNLGDLDGTQLQRESLNFSFHLVMSTQPMPDSQACLPLPPPSPPSAGGPQLGVTGAAVPIAAIVAATVLAALGAVLITRRRNKGQ